MNHKYCLYLIFFLVSILLFPKEATSKNKYTVKIIQPNPVESPTICSVTVTLENKNQIVWYEPNNENVQFFNIYRESTDGNQTWLIIGKAISPTDSSFVDPTSFPNVRSYDYRISTVDRCGNEIFDKTENKTIKLSLAEMVNHSYMLMWNSYEGINVTGYKIYRGMAQNSLALIDSTAASETNYADTNNPYKNVFYQVEALGKPIDTLNIRRLSLNKFKSRSNIASERSVISTSDSLDALNIKMYPNPLITNCTVIFPYDPTQNYQLSILDLLGHPIYQKPVYSGELEIERGGLKEGIYILQIAGKKIYRKKLIVGRV